MKTARRRAPVFAIVACSTQRPIAKSNGEPIIGGICKSLAKYTRSLCLFPLRWLVFFQLRYSVSRRTRRKFDDSMIRRLDDSTKLQHALRTVAVRRRKWLRSSLRTCTIARVTDCPRRFFSKSPSWPISIYDVRDFTAQLSIHLTMREGINIFSLLEISRSLL